MMMKKCLALFVLFLLASPALAAGKAKHVVIVVMDGLRADSVIEADMPNLSKLAKGGVFFDHHHPVYLSTTEVNGTALATGMQPRHSRIIGNREYRPEIEPLRSVDTQSDWVVWKGDQLTGGKWIYTQTLPQIVRAAGRKTAVCGTKSVAMLWDRSWEGRSVDQPTVYGGDTIPGALKDSLVHEYGPIPHMGDNRFFANAPQDHWTTRVLTDQLWKAGLPALSVLWLSEPDYSQHGTGPGSKVARAGLASSDDCLGRVLAALDAMKLREQTDVMVVSDHGFSTVWQGIDIMDDLGLQGFEIGGLFLDKPKKGNVVMVGLGGSVAFYVIDHDAPTIAKLVSYLQTTPYAGVLFTREKAEGAFELSDVAMNSPAAPDVLMAMRWRADKINREGAMPGLLLIEGKGYKTGQGMHGSLSRFDMHNTLVASGPDFKVGFKNETPSGNSDVAPTVLNILGITPKEPMDGRVLEEAFINAAGQGPKVETTIMQANRAQGDKHWQQYLKISKVGKQTYYDEGNVGAPPGK